MVNNCTGRDLCLVAAAFRANTGSSVTFKGESRVVDNGLKNRRVEWDPNVMQETRVYLTVCVIVQISSASTYSILLQTSTKYDCRVHSALITHCFDTLYF